MGVLGKANIGGVLRNLTGEGYVNIGGVLRPITIGNFNIGGVLLAGVYTWKKYTAAETITSYAKKTDENVTFRRFHYSQNVTTYMDMKFDESTGKFTLSISNTKSASSISLTYPYYGSSGSTEVYKLTAKKGSEGSGSQVYYKYDQIKYYSEPVIAYSQGTYIEDVIAASENAYPDNGRHTDGYWYVKQ